MYSCRNAMHIFYVSAVSTSNLGRLHLVKDCFNYRMKAVLINRAHTGKRTKYLNKTRKGIST